MKRLEREDRRENGNTNHRIARGGGGGGRNDPGRLEVWEDSRLGEERLGGGSWRQQEELQDSFPPSQSTQSPADIYSGISELEDRRDRGRSSTPARPAVCSGEDLVPCLRLLTALEDTIGSLGPAVNQLVARALSLEQRRQGSSKVMLEDPETASLLEMVKEKLSGQLEAGLVSGSREGAVRVSLDHLTRLLQVATKKRPVSLSSLLPPPSRLEAAEDGERERNKALIAETLASSLVLAGRQDIREDQLELILEELLRVTALEDPHSSLGRYAKTFLEVTASEREAASRTENQFNSYESARPVRSRPPLDREAAGGLDNLTLTDLRSLMRNFQTLSRPEQINLMSYMKKLETSDPEKVRKVKEGMRTPPREEPEARNDWSPPFSKRRRRLSGSDLEINPVNPHSDHHREEREEDWEQEPSFSREDFTQRNFRSVNTQETARVGSFGISQQQSGGFGGLRNEEEEFYNPFQRSVRQEQNFSAEGGFGGGSVRNPAFTNREREEGIPLLNPPVIRQSSRYQNW